jgi:hypothetical protein
MMKQRWPTMLAAFMSFFSAQVLSQEHHYWTNQFGSRAALMSGAIVGGVRDTSAGFYNPGALGFLKASTFSASGNGYQLESVDISNGAGTGIDVDSSNTNIIPLLISGTFALGNNTFGYSLLAKNKSSIKLSGRHEESAFAGLDSNPNFTFNPSTGEPMESGLFDGPETYRGQFTYDSDVSEFWAGLSWAHQVHDNISVGISGFLALRDQSFNTVQFGRMTNINSEFIASEDSFLNMEFYNVRGLLKFGAAADFDALKIGATLTTPSVSLYGKGTVAGGEGQFKEDDAIGYLADDRQDDLDAEYKTPLSLALGLEYAISQKTSVAGTIEWFAEQKRYDVITPNSKNFFVSGEHIFIDSQEVLKVEDKADSVVNYAIAVEHAFSNKIKGYLGFRTDFSTFPGYEASYKKMGINNWDIYHMTVGIARQGESSELALGFTYSFGSQDNFEQLAEINPADRSGDDYILALNSEGEASADYQALALIIGYTYYFK